MTLPRKPGEPTTDESAGVSLPPRQTPKQTFGHPVVQPPPPPPPAPETPTPDPGETPTKG